MSKAELDQSKFWTEAEYLALDHTDNRIELIDGRLKVTPPPNNAHDGIAGFIFAALWPPARTIGYRTFLTPRLRLSAERWVVPDLAVGRLDWNALDNDAADVVLVVEVISPSNASFDRGRKMGLYAEAKIEWYLLVEPDFIDYESVTLRLHRLQGESYVEHAVAKQGETLRLDELFEVTLNTDDLIDP